MGARWLRSTTARRASLCTPPRSARHKACARPHARHTQTHILTPPPLPPPPSSVALLALFATAALADKITISDDPLDLSNEFPADYRNWASLLSNVLLKKEGSEEGAAKALERVMLATHGHLSKVANGEEIFPRFHLQDPVLTLGDGGLAKGAPGIAATKFASSATFFNYAPCVLSEG